MFLSLFITCLFRYIFVLDLSSSLDRKCPPCVLFYEEISILRVNNPAYKHLRDHEENTLIKELYTGRFQVVE